MHKAIRTVVEKTSKGLSISGIERLSPNKVYLFIANHRDILLDSALLQIALVENGLETTEITFGENLMQKGLVTDLGKLNRMFIVQREGTGKELYTISQNISGYIREKITKKNNSIWIAQRGGRTKDGDDITQSGLLKMLNISGTKSCDTNFNELNIIPLTISYEYEPCDSLKTKEEYLSNLSAKYIKRENEDIESLKKGILDYKGGIHLSFGSEIKMEQSLKNDRACYKKMAQRIDKIMSLSYRLWPNNYIAYDMKDKSNRFSHAYTQSDVDRFNNHVNKAISSIEGDQIILRELFLSIYANPVKNALKHDTSLANMTTDSVL
tara:strand:- start:402 stop:1373 length:972 start_codon:yes stop_codon:yes gene_type:complete